MSKRGRIGRNVLLYSPRMPSRTTVRNQYALWRLKQGVPRRCDNEECEFHTRPLIWNGRPLPLILDHVEGNKYENSPQFLRYLCPNCNAQLETAGGKNRGRVSELTEHGYVVNLGEGRKIVAATAMSSPLTEKQIAALKEMLPDLLAHIQAQESGVAEAKV